MSSSGSRRASALLLAVALAASRDAAADPLADLETAQRELFRRVAPSVVYITTRTGAGSGFFVSGDGWILTNSHVVSGGRSPCCSTAGSATRVASWRARRRESTSRW